MTESKIYKDIYLELKAIFSGCDTIIDANNFSNIYINKYPYMKSMINSYMYGLNYHDKIDMKIKQSIMDDINMCDNRDDALERVSKIINKTNDDVFKKALERIANRKKHKKRERYTDHTNNITKSCPHCSHTISMPEDTQYVICGYHNSNHGYDWIGCGRDWCFQCNKMLCKRWEIDNLHLQLNRYHDKECCLNHSQKNGYSYPRDYCQCNNMNLLTSLNSTYPIYESNLL